jgi:alkanesulfonate monooxygenase SsuD/methylene tetrahydromethanopterin reductase-like flavin-dependent oxidoreductase (luciferase family)
MRFGLSLPNLGVYADVRALADLARAAEAAGWDGVFLWDSLHGDPNHPVPVVDPWVALTAIALATERVRLGPMVTPVARRRPWVLARQAATLDHLSGGRLVLGVGLGDPAAGEYGAFGEPTDAQVRAAMLDEGLAVLTGLWSGKPFSFAGAHARVREATFLPPPVQRPRVPIWVGGWWPNRAPMRRAARWDGAFPGKLAGMGVGMLTPDEVRAIAAFIGGRRAGDGPFDLVVAGTTPGDDPGAAAALVAQYAAAGATWWVESFGEAAGSLAGVRARIRHGPPPVDRPASSAE